jgi:hypothetical protein
MLLMTARGQQKPGTGRKCINLNKWKMLCPGLGHFRAEGEV